MCGMKWRHLCVLGLYKIATICSRFKCHDTHTVPSWKCIAHIWSASEGLHVNSALLGITFYQCTVNLVPKKTQGWQGWSLAWLLKSWVKSLRSGPFLYKIKLTLTSPSLKSYHQDQMRTMKAFLQMMYAYTCNKGWFRVSRTCAGFKELHGSRSLSFELCILVSLL